jgi:hypothetical protein
MTKFEDVYLGVSPGDNGLRIVYSRNYEDKRPSSLVVRDGQNTLVVVKEVPLNSGKSLITLALDAYDSIDKHPEASSMGDVDEVWKDWTPTGLQIMVWKQLFNQT